MPFRKGWLDALQWEWLLVPHRALAHASGALLHAGKSGNVALMLWFEWHEAVI